METWFGSHRQQERLLGMAKAKSTQSRLHDRRSSGGAFSLMLCNKRHKLWKLSDDISLSVCPELLVTLLKH